MKEKIGANTRKMPFRPLTKAERHGKIKHLLVTGKTATYFSL